MHPECILPGVCLRYIQVSRSFIGTPDCVLHLTHSYCNNQVDIFAWFCGTTNILWRKLICLWMTMQTKQWVSSLSSLWKAWRKEMRWLHAVDEFFNLFRDKLKMIIYVCVLSFSCMELHQFRYGRIHISVICVWNMMFLVVLIICTVSLRRVAFVLLKYVVVESLLYSWYHFAGNSPSPVNSPHKGQWRGTLVFSFIWS